VSYRAICLLSAGPPSTYRAGTAETRISSLPSCHSGAKRRTWGRELSAAQLIQKARVKAGGGGHAHSGSRSPCSEPWARPCPGSRSARPWPSCRRSPPAARGTHLPRGLRDQFAHRWCKGHTNRLPIPIRCHACRGGPRHWPSSLRQCVACCPSSLHTMHTRRASPRRYRTTRPSACRRARRTPAPPRCEGDRRRTRRPPSTMKGIPFAVDTANRSARIGVRAVTSSNVRLCQTGSSTLDRFVVSRARSALSSRCGHSLAKKLGLRMRRRSATRRARAR
jgi:hypothetical protein